MPSRFASRFTQSSGIGVLMEDLGKAMAEGGDVMMLGGGNPAHIPEVQSRFRERMETILGSPGEFERVIGNYDEPEGNPVFRKALADLLRREHGWEIGPQNIALTLGSQTAFFMLFNLFAGECQDGRRRKILLPLAPEYIGYSDVGLTEDFFATQRAEIKMVGDHLFKYHIDFDALRVTDDIGAICVSRPTNPTGNVLTDAEVNTLSDLARENGIPLIIDNAYGAPFPNILFTDVKPIWDDHIILSMSLSKLGLPATRTGIVIASEEVITALGRMNGILSLAPTGIGTALAHDLVQSGEIIQMSQDVIRPFYEKRANAALAHLTEELDGLDFRIHCPEGALFLWLWIPNLPITSEELYERLKERSVIVVPGHYFFPGLRDEWPHRQECLRLNHSMDEEMVARGLSVIADEVKRSLR